MQAYLGTLHVAMAVLEVVNATSSHRGLAGPLNKMLTVPLCVSFFLPKLLLSPTARPFPPACDYRADSSSTAELPDQRRIVILAHQDVWRSSTKNPRALQSLYLAWHSAICLPAGLRTYRPACPIPGRSLLRTMDSFSNSFEHPTAS